MIVSLQEASSLLTLVSAFVFIDVLVVLAKYVCKKYMYVRNTTVYAMYANQRKTDNTMSKRKMTKRLTMIHKTSLKN